ncbi:hypothetical protein BS47DRAFT_1340692 [Hydnum rufescens UP504]|uniref:Uncharacterized protein n=1 Tax=Hydnum rufescens UP504 TaxID=1448309 RepID=A0A9P6DWM5_9AGAM|nr:hypothetical protein BS47DRAFT_1340692 [Hydnum rufescens UP504]
MARLALVGIVTKVGVMAKTSTVTVTRHVDHPVTRKVCDCAFMHSLDFPCIFAVVAYNEEQEVSHP